VLFATALIVTFHKIPTVNAAADPCPNTGVANEGNKNYYKGEGTKNWNAAKSSCETRGHYLAVWETRDELVAIKGLTGEYQTDMQAQMPI